MKKLTGCLLVLLMLGMLSGCYSTACQPDPQPRNFKGEG